MTKGFSPPQMMSPDAQLAMEDVIDVADACRAWFEHCALPYAAADMLMSRMVMKREQEIADATKRAKWERNVGMKEPA